MTYQNFLQKIHRYLLVNDKVDNVYLYLLVSPTETDREDDYYVRGEHMFGDTPLHLRTEGAAYGLPVNEDRYANAVLVAEEAQKYLLRGCSEWEMGNNDLCAKLFGTRFLKPLLVDGLELSEEEAKQAYGEIAVDYMFGQGNLVMEEKVEHTDYYSTTEYGHIRLDLSKLYNLIY